MTIWKRTKLDEFNFPTVADYNKEYISYNKLPMGVSLSKINENNKELTKDHSFTGVGEKFTSHVINHYNTGINLNISKDVKIQEPITINFNMDHKNPTVVEQNIIVSSPNSNGTIVFDYSSKDHDYTFHNGITRVYAGENSVVNIVKIQRMNDKSHHFDANIAYIKSGAKVNWISIELGCDISNSNYTSVLEDEASNGDLASIYLGDGNRKIDLDYTMMHQGQRSISHIESHGVLMDNATKMFRGNLDFKKGAKHSKGVEEEFVVLLDPTVKSQSIPALLCGEDDVEGEHAASAGQIDENQLFYLMSRGLNMKEAKQLIITASFRPILDKIPVENLRTSITNEINRRLSYD